MTINKRRLCLFRLEDSGGILDRYAAFFLREMSAFCTKTVIVSQREIEENGHVLPEAENLIVPGTAVSGGFSVKKILDVFGWEELLNWDEVLLTDSSIMGPVCSIGKMFEEMDARSELDFWGLSARRRTVEKKVHEETEKAVTEFIPFRLIVLRTGVLRGKAFRDYWDDPLHNGEKATIDQTPESGFTKEMTEAGYRWDVYIRTPEEGKYTADYLLMDPVEALSKQGCPFFLRESFIYPQMPYVCASAGEQPWELFRHLRQCTGYDTDMVLENLIRTCHQDDIVRTLRMTYVLPSEFIMESGPRSSKVALVAHLYYMDLLEKSVHYAGMMPPDADIHVVTCSAENEEKIRKAFSVLPNRITIRVTQNRGRDVGSLLIGAAELLDAYDIVCFYHDKKTNHIKPYTVGTSFAYKTSESILSTCAYVENVIRLFERHPEIGFLSGPNPNHAYMLRILAEEWGENYELAAELAAELGFQIPMSREHIPAAGLGNLFWFRPNAMKPMFRKKWKYEDFPDEPVGLDGTILHAIERLYPFAVQDAGYLPGKVMPDHIAALEMDNLSFYVREFNKLRLNAGIKGNIQKVIEQEKPMMNPDLLSLAKVSNLPDQFRLAMRRLLPKWLRREAESGRTAVPKK